MILKLENILNILKMKKTIFYEMYGVTKIGVFGSFLSGQQTETSDIDIIVEIETDKKNIHNFLRLKRTLEKEFNRSVDIGFEHTLKPTIKDKVKEKIVYV